MFQPDDLLNVRGAQLRSGRRYVAAGHDDRNRLPPRDVLRACDSFPRRAVHDAAALLSNDENHHAIPVLNSQFPIPNAQSPTPSVQGSPMASDEQGWELGVGH